MPVKLKQPPVIFRPEVPVSVNDQVEGPILSLSKEELRQKVHNGQRAFRNIVEATGVQMEELSPTLLAHWVAVDPNAINSLPVNGLDDREQVELSCMLWGFIGAANVTIPTGEGAMESRNVDHKPVLYRSEGSALRERILFTEDGAGHSDRRDEIRSAALVGELIDNTENGYKWVERCHEAGEEELANEALRRYRDSARIEPEKLVERFSWYSPPIEFYLDRQLIGQSPEEILGNLERQEAQAKEYDQYRAAHPRTRLRIPRPRRRRRVMNEYDGVEEVDEEAPIDDSPPPPKHVAHPLPVLLSTERFIHGGRSSMGDFDLAIAVARFSQRHLDDYVELCSNQGKPRPSENPFEDEDTLVRRGPSRADLVGNLVNRVLSTIESHPKEEIPGDVSDFLAAQLSDPEVRNSRYLSYWSLPAAGSGVDEMRSVLDRHFCSQDDVRTIAAVLPDTCETYWLQEYVRDPLIIRGTASWLKNNGKPIAHSQAQLEAEAEKLHGHLKRELQESTGTGDAEYDLRYGLHHGGGGYSGSRGDQWLRHSYAPFIVFLATSDHIPLDEAMACAQNLHHTYMGDASNVLDEQLRNSSHSTSKLRTPQKSLDEQRWRLWDVVSTESPQKRADFLIEKRFLGNEAYRKDVPRFSNTVRKVVLDPLFNQLGQGDYSENRRTASLMLDSLNVLAQYDANEASALFSHYFKNSNPVFREAVGTIIRDAPYYSDDAATSLLRLCYADLAFPRPIKHGHVNRLEAEGDSPQTGGKGGAGQMELPVALALDWEAESGVLWGPRKIPIVEQAAWNDTLLKIVCEQEYPPDPSGSGMGSGDRQAKGTESQEDREQRLSKEQLRDSLLQNIDNPTTGGVSDPDTPELPYAGMLSENPKTIGTLSEPLQGDARYLTMKICDDFDPAWCAHLPMASHRNVDMRSLLHHPVQEVKEVSLTMKMAHGAVIPLPTSGSIDSVDAPSCARVRWAGHWSKRVETPKPVTASIKYNVGEDLQPTDQTLPEVLEAIPPSLLEKTKVLSSQEDLPLEIRRELASIDVQQTPLSTVVQRTAQIVQEYYEYHFIVNNPEYRKRYKQLLEKMPYEDSDKNEYLDFIHSLRQENERILGRGVCGQLATVLQSALRSIGVPAYWAAGYSTSDTEITTNDAHAWVLVPFLDSRQRLFLKPVEATSGGAMGLDRVRGEAERVPTIDEEEQDKTTSQDADQPEADKVSTQQTVSPPIQDDATRWRQYFSGVLNPDIGEALTNDDILAVRELLQQAWIRLGKEKKPEAEVSKNSLPYGKDEIFFPETAMDPRLRHHVKELSKSGETTLTPAARGLITYIQQEGEKAHRQWLERLK